jgi:valyl-tRNA synthetase
VARDAAVEKHMATLQAAIGAARAIRSEHGVASAAEVPLAFRSDSDEVLGFLRVHEGSIRVLVRPRKDKPVPFEKTGGPREAGTAVSVVPTELGSIEVLVGLRGLVKADEERDRIDREIKRLERDIAALDKKLAAKNFTERAPKDVVDETRAQRASLAEARARLDDARKLAAELE